MIDDSWPGQRARYRKLRSRLDGLASPDRAIDAELARLMVAIEVPEGVDNPRLADGSILPRFTAWKPEAESLWRRCLLDEPIPDGDAITICRELVNEAAELFE